jgi:hypothetical protein
VKRKGKIYRYQCYLYSILRVWVIFSDIQKHYAHFNYFKEWGIILEKQSNLGCTKKIKKNMKKLLLPKSLEEIEDDIPSDCLMLMGALEKNLWRRVEVDEEGGLRSK